MIYIDVNEQAVFSDIRMTKGLEATLEVHDIKHEVRYEHDWDRYPVGKCPYNSRWILYNIKPLRNRTFIYAEMEGIEFRQEFWEFDWDRDWEDYVEKHHHKNNIETHIEYEYSTPLIISDSGTFQSVYTENWAKTLEMCHNRRFGYNTVNGWRVTYYDQVELFTD